MPGGREHNIPGAERRGAMATRARRIRLHIKNNRAGEEVFRTTPARLGAALARRPEAARLLDPVIDWDLDNFDASMATADGLVTWELPREDLGRRAPKLKWIHVIGAGVDHLAPLDWLPAGVTLTNNSGVHREKFADYATMALLMLWCGLPGFVSAQRERRWDPVFTPPIAGAKATVVGVGKMGGVVARQAKRLGMTVVGVRRTGRAARNVDVMYPASRLRTALRGADIVAVATPLTPATEGLIGAREFAAMKPGAGFLNVGRGPVIDTSALVAALESGHLGGAILDVFDAEPPPRTSPLWRTPNLVMTPHVAADDLDSYMPRTLDLVLENVVRLANGRPLRNRVDPKAGY